MTLDEAIKHAEEVAEENEKVALYKPIDFCVTCEIEKCTKCAEEHKQLAGWLKELKQLREQTRCQEPCEDAISRQAVLALPRDRIRNMKGEIVEETIDVADIKALPPVNPQEPKTGKWIKYGVPRCGEQHYRCTSCGYYINFGQWGELYTKEFKFCPNCRARMESEE